MALRSQMSSRRDWIFSSSWEGFLLSAAALVVSSFSYTETLEIQLGELFSGGRREEYWYGVFGICLCVRAVVHEHHVVLPSYFLKCVALFPLILSFLKEPGEKQFKCLIDELTNERTEKIMISIKKGNLTFSWRNLWPSVDRRRMMSDCFDPLFPLNKSETNQPGSVIQIVNMLC